MFLFSTRHNEWWRFEVHNWPSTRHSSLSVLWSREMWLLRWLCFFSVCFSLDILESEAKSVLLEIRHPAMKKQVFYKNQYSMDWWVRPALCGSSLYIFTNCSFKIPFRLWRPCCSTKTFWSHVFIISHPPFSTIWSKKVKVARGNISTHMHEVSFMDQDLFIPDPEEVDAGLLQFCSCQLKLLQLYMDMQQLHSAPDGTSFSSNQVAIFML